MISILGQKYRYRIDISKGDIDPPLIRTYDLPIAGPTPYCDTTALPRVRRFVTTDL